MFKCFVVDKRLKGPKKPNEVDSKLMLSFFDMFPLPLRLRKYLRFGYHYKNEDDVNHLFVIIEPLLIF